MPLREGYVWVCGNRRPDGNPKGSCAQKGSEALRDALKIACHNAGLGAKLRVMSSSCIDVCEHGPAMAVMPDDVVLGSVTEADIPALVEALATRGGVAAHPALAGRVLSREVAARAPGAPVSLGRKPAP